VQTSFSPIDFAASDSNRNEQLLSKETLPFIKTHVKLEKNKKLLISMAYDVFAVTFVEV
jgi:hypothetical protein